MFKTLIFGSWLALIAAAGARPVEQQRYYWPVALDSAAVGHFHKHTHVAVTGTVAANYPIREDDGDLHIKLVSESGRFIVAECTPKEPCIPAPKAGQKIVVRGISRQDSEHGWYEVHPVESWSAIAP